MASQAMNINGNYIQQNFPLNILMASIIWLVMGTVCILIAIAYLAIFTLGNGGDFTHVLTTSSLATVVGVSFISLGVATLRGVFASTVGPGMAAMILAFLLLGCGCPNVALDFMEKSAALKNKNTSRFGNEDPVELRASFARFILMIPLFGFFGVGLATSAILFFYGNEKYVSWRDSRGQRQIAAGKPSMMRKVGEFDERFTKQSFPLGIKIASIIWLVCGAVLLLIVLANLIIWALGGALWGPTSVGIGAIILLLFGVIFIASGVVALRGKLNSAQGPGIAAIFFSIVFMCGGMVTAVILADHADEKHGPQKASVAVVSLLAAMISGLLGICLAVSGVLAFTGNKAYIRWREFQAQEELEKILARKPVSDDPATDDDRDKNEPLPIAHRPK